jgi:hypothetical protein
VIIGLHGEAESGKDLTYKLLTEIGEMSGAALKGIGVVRRAFADPLKVSAAYALGFKGTAPECIEFCNRLKEGTLIRVEDTYNYNSLAALTGREYLQFFGTEAHRHVFGDSFWIDQTLPYGWNPTKEMVVVTDVRFDNEAERVLENDGVIWEIVRPGHGIGKAHVSESGINPKLVHRTIVNDGTIDELREKIVEAIGRYDGDVLLSGSMLYG